MRLLESLFLSAALFERLLGVQFTHLPVQVQHLHQWQQHRQSRWSGRCDIQRGDHPLARLSGWITRLPPARDDVATVVEFHADGDGEIWRRDFGGALMQSRLHAYAGLLQEQLGPVQFRFRLQVVDATLIWQVQAVRLFGLLPLPASWFAGVRSQESEVDGRYHFLVDAALPVIGLIVRYRGWLEPV